MGTQPRKKDCYGCSHSHLLKGARCYCPLRQTIVPANEMVLVEHCTLAAAMHRKAEKLVAEAKAARVARRQAHQTAVRHPLTATG